MYTSARIAAAVVAAAGVLALTACGPGTVVVDKSKGHASAKGSGSGKEVAEAQTAAPETAKVGDTLTLKGQDDGSRLDATVLKVVDPAKPADEFTEPGSGKRYVGVQFKLVNTGKVAYSDSPSNGAQIADAQGQQFDATFADITAGPSMSSSLRLKPGAKGLGWIVFEVPKGSEAATVQFTMDSGFADETGEWKVR